MPEMRKECSGANSVEMDVFGSKEHSIIIKERLMRMDGKNATPPKRGILSWWIFRLLTGSYSFFLWDIRIIWGIIKAVIPALISNVAKSMMIQVICMFLLKWALVYILSIAIFKKHGSKKRGHRRFCKTPIYSPLNDSPSSLSL